LDGSPPAYHLDKGFGTGINNWLVQFEVCPFLQIAINNNVLIFYENLGRFYIFGDEFQFQFC